MSMQLSGAIFKCHALDPIDKLLLLSLSECAALMDEENAVVFEDLPGIAEDACITTFDAYTRIRRMLDAGVIKLDHDRRIGKMIARIYLPAMPDLTSG